MKFAVIAVLLLGVTANLFADGLNDKEKQLQAFIAEHVAKVAPMMKEANLTYWAAATSGKEEDYKKFSELQLEVRKIYMNPQEYAMLKEMRGSGQIRDKLLSRQLDKLYFAYLSSQIDEGLMKQIVDLGTKVEQDFSTFRGTIDGKKVTANEIHEILKTEPNSVKRWQAWEASKQVGPVVSADMIKLVKLRNEAARKVGFDNFHTLSLTVSEQDVKQIDKIFNELWGLTNKPFRQVKADLDTVLAAKYGVKVKDLKPWHYHDPFFQETPLVYEVDLDTFYKGKDVKDIAVKFYDGIDLPVDSIVAHSDLYEREGKNPHGFCQDMDRQGDIRVLVNLENNERWMETMLHELGHAIYDEYREPNLPYLLREPAHIFTTEGVAMFFGRLSRNPAWMQKMLGLTDAQKQEIEKVSGKYAQLKQLIFARWAMVMYDFEKQLYVNPDQDLNALWWKLVEKYQFIKKPRGRDEPDWASKIHFAIAPCYYHNYVLGELFASQMHHYVVKDVLQLQTDKDVSYVGEKRVGDFMRAKVFAPAAEYRWDDMIERAFGEPLTAKYFVKQFVK